ncbi:MAG: VOC family protein [Nakamurella sp.]
MSTSPEHETPSGRANPTVFATLQARDAPALIDFYVRALGFELTARYDGDDGDDLVAHAQLNWPEGHGALMLGSHSPDKQWSREPGTSSGYVVTAHPELVAARIAAAIPELGGEIVRPLADTDYGGREILVRDPEGNLWSFGDYPGA